MLWALSERLINRLSGMVAGLRVVVMSDKTGKGYRHNVGAVIVNGQDRLLIAARRDYPDSWQFPQGGVDKGESEEQAIIREVGEELGTSKFEIIKKSQTKHTYTFAKGTGFSGYKGQEQVYFLLRFTGTDSEINLHTKHQEFTAWKWIQPVDFPINSAYKPRRPIYASLMKEFFDVDLA